MNGKGSTDVKATPPHPTPNTVEITAHPEAGGPAPDRGVHTTGTKPPPHPNREWSEEERREMTEIKAHI